LAVSRELAVATQIARSAGATLLETADDAVTGVGSKTSLTDLVSDADRHAERMIVSALHDEFPEDDVIAEEGGQVRGTSGRRWYVDPLDGTINHIYGIPHWSVALACEDAGGTLVGVVFDPSRGETFSAERGRGAWRDDEPLRTTAATDLGKALVATGFAYVAEARIEQARILRGVLGAVRDIRRFGSAQLDLAWTAAARFDGYFESVDKPWDWMAGALIVREAGGRVTQLEPKRAGQPHIVASAPGIHDSLVMLLRAAVQDG
jgi:myo-inositol-1(or 4)-monophosphatase